MTIIIHDSGKDNIDREGRMSLVDEQFRSKVTVSLA